MKEEEKKIYFIDYFATFENKIDIFSVFSELTVTSDNVEKNTFNNLSPSEFALEMLSLQLESTGQSSNALQQCDPQRQKFHLKKSRTRENENLQKKLSGPGGLCYTLILNFDCR